MAKTWPTVKDRNVATPSRVQLNKVDLEPTIENVYDVEPITGTVSEQGTPVNKALFDAIHDYVDTPATTEVAGVVKPDGTSIQVAADGTIFSNVSVEIPVPVSKGGTGLQTIAADSVLLGNNNNTLKTVSKLPVTQGGTNGATNVEARTNLQVPGCVTSNGWLKLTFPDGSDQQWIQTTSNGLLPIAANSSSLGSWDYQFAESRVYNPYKRNRSMQGYAVIYNNTSGSAGTVTCTESCANFSWIEIVFTTNDSSYNTAKVYGPNGKSVDLMGVSSKSSSSTSSTYLKTRKVTISGATISNTSGYISAESSITSANSCNVWAANNVLITQVIGYV